MLHFRPVAFKKKSLPYHFIANPIALVKPDAITQSYNSNVDPFPGLVAMLFLMGKNVHEINSELRRNSE